MSSMEKKRSSGWVAPDVPDVGQLSHACCRGEQLGKQRTVLTRYISWSSRIRNGCKQRQEQLRAAWAWHHVWRNVAGAATSFSPSLEQPFASLIIITQKQCNTKATLACLHTRTHARTRSIFACFHALVLVQLCYRHKHRVQRSCGTCIHARNECG